MLTQFATILASHTKAALVGAAAVTLLAGGSTVALQSVASSTPGHGAHPSTPGSASVTDHHTSGTHGAHGACVSAVAHTTNAVGRAKGLAISTAAKNCPLPAAADHGANQGAAHSAAGRAKAAAASGH